MKRWTMSGTLISVVRGGERAPDLFRTEPLAERVEPLLSPFALAVASMGALEEAELYAYLSWYPSENRAGEYRYEAPYDSDNGVHRWGVRHVLVRNIMIAIRQGKDLSNGK